MERHIVVLRWVKTGPLRLLAVFSVYFAVALVFFRPWLAVFSSVLIGPPENNLQDFWNVWYAAQAWSGSFFETALLRFPTGTALNFHSFSYPHVLAVAVLAQGLGDSRETLIWLNNAALFAAFPLSGFTAFLLVRHFVKNDLAALLGGFIFAFNPWHVGQLMHHAHVTHIEFVPLFLLAYLKALEKKSWAWLVAAILSGVLSALSCWYYLFYGAYFLAFHAAYRRWHDKLPLTGWQIAAPLMCLAGMALLLSPLLLPMALQTGAVEHPGGSDAFVADIEAFFAFPTTHVFAAWSQSFWDRAHKWTSNNSFEGAAYLGLVNIALMVWLYRRRRQAPLASYLFWAMGVFGVLAMGDCIHAFGFDTLIPLPGLIPNHLPFLSQVRTPGRSMMLVYLFLGVAVAYAVTLLAAQANGRKWLKPGLAALAALIVLDFYPAVLETTDARCPAGLEIIKNDPEKGFGVLNLPFPDLGDLAMFQQTCHGKPVVQAAISRSVRPPLVDTLDRYDIAVQRRQLIAAHVKYLVIDAAWPWEPPVNPAKYALRAWAVRMFPALAKVHWIAVPKSKPFLSQAAYRKTFPVVYRSQQLTILRVE